MIRSTGAKGLKRHAALRSKCPTTWLGNDAQDRGGLRQARSESFGARSMIAKLDEPHVYGSQQRIADQAQPGQENDEARGLGEAVVVFSHGRRLQDTDD